MIVHGMGKVQVIASRQDKQVGKVTELRNVSYVIMRVAINCQKRSPLHLSISGEQVPSFWVPTLPSVLCRSRSCCFCQQLSPTALSSFPTSLTSVFVAVCMYSVVVDLVLLVCKPLWWALSLLFNIVCSSWSLGSNQSWCFLSSFSSHWTKALSISCSSSPYG